MKFFMIRICALAVLLCLSGQMAMASKYGGGEAYSEPTFRELAQTMMFMDGFKTEDVVIDEYAKLMYCALYNEKFTNDFEWNKIRSLLLQKIQTRKDYFRVLYQISGVIYLGRYNFETQDFPFINDSALVNVGSLVLFDATNNADLQRERILCGGKRAVSLILPAYYVFRLNQPLTFDRLKIPMDEAQKLLSRMQKSKNDERALFVRFRVRAIAAQPASKVQAALEAAVLSGEMTAIDLFLDKEMTQPFASVEVR